MTTTLIRPPMPPLCQSIVENPNSLESSHRLKGRLYRTIAVVSAVALSALFALTTAVYFGFLPVLSLWHLIPMLVTGYACMKGLKLWPIGAEQLAHANFYRSIVEKLQKNEQAGGLKDWGAGEVHQFLIEQSIYEARTADEASHALAHQEISAPLTLLPLIARFKVIEDQAKKIQAVYEDNLAKANAFTYPDELRLEAEHRFVAISKLERLASLRLHAAILLQNLQNARAEYDVISVRLPKDPVTRPNQKYLAKVLCKLGNESEPLAALHMKEREGRILDFIAHREQVFLEPAQGNPLTLTQIKDLSPKQLREAIFGPAPRLNIAPA